MIAGPLWLLVGLGVTFLVADALQWTNRDPDVAEQWQPPPEPDNTGGYLTSPHG